jgi:hypothetical protein
LDLEDEDERVKLSNPARYFADHEHDLVILDEVHRVPELFQRLRGIIDRGRRQGKQNGRFLLLGSAAMDLLRQSGESLAGRISYLELGPFDALEVAPSATETLWVRGGFPLSFLAENDAVSMEWRRNFIRTYLERDVPQFGSRRPTWRAGWALMARPSPVTSSFWSKIKAEAAHASSVIQGGNAVKIPFAVFRIWQAGAAALPAAGRHREWLGRNVDAQISLGAETPTGRIAQRLMSEGLDRHDAIHAIGRCSPSTYTTC